MPGRRRRSPLAAAVVGLGVAGVGISGPAMSTEIRPIDLKIASGVTSIATRADGRGFVVAFVNCRIAVLDRDAVLQSQREIVGCQRLFTIHVAQDQPTETWTGSIYTGRAVVLRDGKITAIKTHDAAVTDAFLAFGGLLSASDDGTVILSPLDGRSTPKRLASGQGVARVLLPDLSAPASSPVLFQGFDSGTVAAVSGARTDVFAMGVGRINGLALSGDRKTLYAAGFNGRLRDVTLATGETRDVFSGDADINALAADETASRLALAIEDGRLVVLDARSRATLLDSRIAKSGLTAVAFDADGRRALVGDETGSLYLVDIPRSGGPTP